MCRHEWREVRRQHTPPPRREVEMGSGTQEIFERLVFGITTVELQCVKCRDIQGRILLGDLQDPLPLGNANDSQS